MVASEAPELATFAAPPGDIGSLAAFASFPISSPVGLIGSVDGNSGRSGDASEFGGAVLTSCEVSG
jgi:hypothetical protein